MKKTILVFLMFILHFGEIYYCNLLLFLYLLRIVGKALKVISKLLCTKIQYNNKKTPIIQKIQ